MRIFLLSTLVFIVLSSCGPFKGPKGDGGDSGKDGTSVQGPAGPKGDPGTSITLVALCSGDSVYPSTFVEYAFCVGGELYATYSANGGFSTKLPPGNYTSSGINSSCSFTVAAGCQVSSNE